MSTKKVKSIIEGQDNSKLTLKQIKMKYKAMKRAAEAREVETAGETNCYVCTSCKHVDKYQYADSGTTSFMNTCSKCEGSSQSEYGQNNYPDIAPTMEWYRPSLNHVQLMQGKFPAILDHVLNGGLMPRKITDTNQ